MEKSKFKTVRFKPFDLELEYSQRSDGSIYWTNNAAFGNDVLNDIYLTDSCIETYPELFEVEKAEREFEDGANYALYSSTYNHGYTLGYYNKLLNGFYVIGTNKLHNQMDFDRIGEKIEP